MCEIKKKGDMEVRKLFERSLSPLVTKSFAIKWSEDHRLAVVTPEGVHVFEVVPSPAQINPIIDLRRTYIQAPGMIPGEYYMKEVLSKIYDWKKEEIYSFLMHEAYTPSFPKCTKATVEITDIFWSPQDLLYPYKCLIAIVTSVGAVELASQLDRSWFTICSISDAWIQVIDKDFKILQEETKIDSASLKNQLDRMFVTTATWSCIYKSSDTYFAYLVTAHRNSEIAVWKINRKVSEELRTDLNLNAELKIKKKVTDVNVKINTLLWIHVDEKNYLVVLGFYNGPIGLLKLKEVNDELIVDTYSLPFPDEDNIPVDYLNILHQTNEFIELVVVKGLFFIILVIDVNGNQMSLKFISSPKFSITGTSIIDPNTVLIATQDGQLCEIKKSPDLQQELTCRPVKTDIPSMQVQYLGLANSRNKVQFILITSPNVMYDHLTDREPSTLFFFSLTNSPLPQPLDLTYREKCLLKCWDCLELVKVNALRYNEVPQNLADNQDMELESLTKHELRVAYWLLMIVEAARRKNNTAEEAAKLAEQIQHAKSCVFLHCASERLERLSSLADEQLSKQERLSAYLLRSQLEIWLAGEEDEPETALSSQVRSALEVSSRLSTSGPELCELCAEPILEPWASSCPRGHKLPRCALTWLQVTSASFRSCSVCREIFHPCLDEVRCPYCDLPASFRNRTIGPELQVSERNLSKKKVEAGKEAKEDKV